MASAERKLSALHSPAEAARAAARLTAELYALAELSDREGAFPSREFALIAEAGLLSVNLPRDAGGLGLGSLPHTTWPLLLILKSIGRGNLAVGRIYEGHVNALQLIHTFGTARQLSYFADEVTRDSRLFGVWNTQGVEGGVKIHAIGGGRYRLQGSKTFASGGGDVHRPLITGALIDENGDLGWQMCVVPLDETKVEVDASWWRPLGMRASASFRVNLSGVEIDSTHLIGRPGDYYRQPWFGGGAVRFAAVQLGAAEALFFALRDYLRDLRRTTDVLQQTRAGQIAVMIESGRQWLRGAARVAETRAGASSVDDAPAVAERIVAYANMTRTAIEAICLDVMRLVERGVGARGLLRPHPIERIHRDLTMYLRQPSPDAALIDIGRYALDRDDAFAETIGDENGDL